MTQTLAIFYEAYCSLNAKKMFWIVLAISVLVVGGIACVGIDEHGTTILWWNVGGQSTHDVSHATFYKQAFSMAGIEFWLAWPAVILALISTASIFPDLVSGGSISLVLSKPIGRLRLFLTQYTAGLLFVALQVTLFSFASFLVIGVRGGAWLPGIFLAIPLVVCLFSYLFSVCTLIGLATRSTVAGILLTLLFWLLLYGLSGADFALAGARSPSRTWQGDLLRLGNLA